MNHLEKSKELGLNPEEYVLIGGSVLDIHGIRKSSDIDVVVSKVAFQKLKERGWEVDKVFLEKWGRERLKHDVFEVFTDMSWEHMNYLLPFEAVLTTAHKIDGVNVQPLGMLLLGKKDNNRPKDHADCVLIEKYLGIID
jgi:hypothetical protein